MHEQPAPFAPTPSGTAAPACCARAPAPCCGYPSALRTAQESITTVTGGVSTHQHTYNTAPLHVGDNISGGACDSSKRYSEERATTVGSATAGRSATTARSATAAGLQGAMQEARRLQEVLQLQNVPNNGYHLLLCLPLHVFQPHTHLFQATVDRDVSGLARFVGHASQSCERLSPHAAARGEQHRRYPQPAHTQTSAASACLTLHLAAVIVGWRVRGRSDRRQAHGGATTGCTVWRRLPAKATTKDHASDAKRPRNWRGKWPSE